jgi:hypothetical protein
MTDPDAGDASVLPGDAGSDGPDAAVALVVCDGVKCGANQMCVHRCAAIDSSSSCFLGNPPSGPVDQCVDLPSGCSPEAACGGCLPLDTECPTSGPRAFLDCENQGPQEIKCLCGCTF